MNKTKHLARYSSFELNLTSDKNKLQSWRNGPAVTITWFSCRGLGFGSQHPHCSLQPFITLPRPCWDYPLLCISDCQSPAVPDRQWHRRNPGRRIQILKPALTFHQDPVMRAGDPVQELVTGLVHTKPWFPFPAPKHIHVETVTPN